MFKVKQEYPKSTGYTEAGRNIQVLPGTRIGIGQKEGLTVRPTGQS